MARDYYQVLGIGREAQEEDIKKAYRKLARQYHPDANREDPQAEEKFKEIAEAYAVLSDPARRRDYDLFGTAKVPAGGFDPFDLFSSFFGGDLFGAASARRGTRTGRGNDLGLELAVTLEEAVKGASKMATIHNLQTCEACQGSGCAPGTSPARCSRCAGTGAVRQVQRSIFGNLMSSFTCPTCRGTGQEIASPCQECNGEGRLERLDEIPIEVPAGVRDGVQLRISGRGEAGARGGGAGDLYVQIRVLADERFVRRGDDLLTAHTVSVTQAALGAAVEVETFDGPAKLTIPSGTQPGRVLRVRGRGVPHLGRAGRGDLLVEVRVEVPTNLSEEESKLLRRLAALRGEPVSDQTGIIGKIKSAFQQS
jgi:molecular chaperone DnaJ